MRPTRGLLLLLGGLVLVLGACSHETEGPKPSVQEETATFCGDLESVFTIRGDGLSPMVVDGATDDAQIELPRVCLVQTEDEDGQAVSNATPVCLDEEDVRWISQQEMEITISAELGLEPGLYDVIITNPDGTEARGRFHLRVLAGGPMVFWVDPRVVWNGMSTQITVYGSGLGDAVAGVSIVDESGAETVLDFTADAERPNRLRAVVPTGTAVGDWDVVVRDAVGCVADLPDGLTVTDAITLELDGIDPLFGWAEQPTAVTISGAGFQAVPRAYLNPAEPGPETVATSLASVSMLSEERLSAVVPEGQPTGGYDLVVVNPDGAVGVVEDAFLVTGAPPPVIDNVTPGSLDNDTPKDVTIQGASFRNPTVTMTCRAPDGTITELEGTVADSTETRISASLPVDGLDAGTVCIIRVTDDDGSYFDYSAIGITNPASNLAPFAAAESLGTARRAPGVVAGRATRTARFLYAVGGDDGSTAGALATVESSAVDVFGVPSPWFEQPVSLPGARTLAGLARIGDFLWLVGGNDGTGATTSVLRAEVLDPLDAPVIDDVAARRREDGEDDLGIGAGIWSYRVSAVMADDDPDNPGGETLASDPLVLELPDDLAEPLIMTLMWAPVAGAKGYRIYRSPDPDMPSHSEVLVGEVTDGAVNTYEDTGEPTAATPLPLGATGVWAAMPALGTAREAAGVAIAQDPADAAVWHLYAIGGRDGSGGALATGERLSVTIGADGSQTVDAWVAIDNPLATARAELALYSVSHAQAVRVPEGTTYLYAAGGTGSTEVDAASVQAGGELSAWTAEDSMSPARAGYAALAGADFLFAFGGQNGAASDGGVSAEIDPPPDLVNWNNEGERLVTPRYLSGATVESAFIYIVGGDDGSGPTASTERTVL